MGKSKFVDSMVFHVENKPYHEDPRAKYRHGGLAEADREFIFKNTRINNSPYVFFKTEPPWRLSEKATKSKRLLSTTAPSIWIDRHSDQTLSSKWAHRWTKEDLPWMITLTSLATWALIAGLSRSSISSQWQRETRTWLIKVVMLALNSEAKARSSTMKMQK